MAEVAGTLRDLIAEGKALHFGLSEALPRGDPAASMPNSR